jgi:hypothetical protein
MDHVEQAAELMLQFAQRTGLSSERAKQRYLWTDAFAVCNFLGLAQATSEPRYRELALTLVDQVHRVLGRHRADDARRGWISALGEELGAAHPTQGGLRIGKPLPERALEQAFDERLEWERDGQYFHYLTRWMHALDQLARATQQPRWNRYARELASAAHDAFTYQVAGRGELRMFWKMSIDLSRPLVASMGQHDALDGLVTCAELQTTAALLSGASDGPQLENAAADFAAMARGQHWASADPLGIGGLLIDAQRIAALPDSAALASREWLDGVLAAALEGLSDFMQQRDLSRPASARLAFRELGLAIGLRALNVLARELGVVQRSAAIGGVLRERIPAFKPYLGLDAIIESFWLEPEHRRTRVWMEHRDINDVMLATCLAPEGYLLGSGGVPASAMRSAGI